MFPVLALATLSAWTGAAQPRTSAIPPIPGKKAYRLSLPPYQAFCWFSADRGRWPGDGNRVLPWFGRTSPGNLLDSRPNPSTAKPGDHAMFALFHLKDGNFMALLPVAAPDSLSWLKLERDGTFLVEDGSLELPPPNRRPFWPSPPRTGIFTAPAPPHGTRPFPFPSSRAEPFHGKRKFTRNRSSTSAGAAGSSTKRIFPPSCLKKRPDNWKPPPFPSGGCWWTTDSRPRKTFNWSVSNPGRTDSPGAGSP